MRCVVSTPFGRPVDPEVKPILAIVSGPSAARASSTARVGTVRTRSPMPTACAGTSGRTTSSTRAYASPSSANTSPGVHRSTISRTRA